MNYAIGMYLPLCVYVFGHYKLFVQGEDENFLHRTNFHAKSNYCDAKQCAKAICPKGRREASPKGYRSAYALAFPTVTKLIL